MITLETLSQNGHKIIKFWLAKGVNPVDSTQKDAGMSIEIIRSQVQLEDYLDRKGTDTLGFVPTMGTLHKGHLDLVKRALSECDQAVCSIFVNPTQFNDPSDFNRYPRNTEKDVEQLDKVGCTAAFIPSPGLIYPDKEPKLLDYYDPLFDTWEGEFRPGHFKGVVTVIERFFSLLRPDKAYFGLKDYQQYLVIKLAFQKLLPDVEVIGVETVREDSGLAMSSRNELLSAKDRQSAVGIIKGLKYIADSVGKLSIQEASKNAMEIMASTGLEPEYVAITDASSLEPLTEWGQPNTHAALAAGFVDKVRLIDNLRF